MSDLAGPTDDVVPPWRSPDDPPNTDRDVLVWFCGPSIGRFRDGTWIDEWGSGTADPSRWRDLPAPTLHEHLGLERRVVDLEAHVAALRDRADAATPTRTQRLRGAVVRLIGRSMRIAWRHRRR